MTHQFAYPYHPYHQQPYPWQLQQTSKSKNKHSLLYPYPQPYPTVYPQYYVYPPAPQQQQQQQLAPAADVNQQVPPHSVSTLNTTTTEKKRVGLVRSDTTEFEISEILSKVGLVRLPIPPDGSCMFRAVAEQKLGSQLLHEWLRYQVVEKLKENKERFSKHLQLIEETMSWDDYIDHISSPSSWGGELELQAISLIFRANIVIYSSTGCTKMDNGFEDINNQTDILLWYSHGNHYDACIREKKMDSLLFCQKIVIDLVNLLFEDEREVKDDQEAAVSDPQNPYARYRNYPYESWLKARQKQQSIDSSIAMTIVTGEVQKEEEVVRSNETAALTALKEEEREYDNATWKLSQQLSSSPPLYPTSILHFLPSSSYKKKSKKDKHEEKDKKKKGFKKQFVGLFKYHHATAAAPDQVRNRSLSQ